MILASNTGLWNLTIILRGVMRIKDIIRQIENQHDHSSNALCMKVWSTILIEQYETNLTPIWLETEHMWNRRPPRSFFRRITHIGMMLASSIRVWNLSLILRAVTRLDDFIHWIRNRHVHFFDMLFTEVWSTILIQQYDTNLEPISVETQRMPNWRPAKSFFRRVTNETDS